MVSLDTSSAHASAAALLATMHAQAPARAARSAQRAHLRPNINIALPPTTMQQELRLAPLYVMCRHTSLHIFL